MSPLRVRRPRATCLATAASLAVLSACGSQVAPARSPASTATDPIAVSVSDCGSGWHPTTAGGQVLVLHNTDVSSGEVQVLGQHGLLYAEVEPFGPGTTVTVHVRLAAGTYRLACLMEDSAPVTGPRRTIAGPGAGTPGIRPITLSQLVRPTKRYTAWVVGQIPGLVQDTRRLAAAVSSGDLASARRAWLVAHLDYQRLGAAYDAFGDVGDRIDGLPQGLPRGTADPHWHGFHRVERDLWVSAQRSRLGSDTTALVHAVSQLEHSVGQVRIDPLAITIRAHEIAENALQFQLTGLDDFGSHTDLASVRAELAGTRAVLRALRRPLEKRVNGVGAIRASLRAATETVTRAEHAHPGVAVSRLPEDVREQVDAAVSLLTARLSRISATLEPRRVVSAEQGGRS